MSAPASTIHICSGVRLDNRYDHTIYFADAAAQQGYFAGKVVKTFSAYTYLRKSWPLQVQATMEEARTWTYLYFRNGSGKVYYYFITQVEYKNENTVELSLELDVLQTYLGTFTLLPSFIEREHTESDTLGAHTIDEGLELGELKESNVKHWGDLNELCILVLSTFNPNYSDTEKPVQALGGVYNNTFSGLSVWAVNATHYPQLTTKLESLTEAGFIDGILSMWMYPKMLVQLGGENTWSDNLLFKVVAFHDTNRHAFTYTNTAGTIDGVTVKNKKLLAYPYRSLYVTNNQGGSAVYRFEWFDTPGAPSFKVAGATSPDGSVKMCPENYSGVTTNYDRGLTLGNFPTCAWNSDVFKLWLAQNQHQTGFAMATGGISVLGGVAAAAASIATGNIPGALAGAGAAISGAQKIGTLLAQTADMEIQPPQSRGNYSATVNVAQNMQTYSFMTKHIDAQHARALDDYFTMYGYRINRVGVPNINARPAFTYVKTVGCNLSGNLCTEDRNKIAAIFDCGITWWKNGDRIADYSQDNQV